MNKKFLVGLSLFCCLGLSSCNLYAPFGTTSSVQPHYYETVKTPYVEIEKSETPGYVELDSAALFKKYDAKDNFVLFIHSTTCGHCTRMDENYLTPFMEETNTVIYSYTTNVNDYADNREQFASYQPSGATFMKDSENYDYKIIAGVPVFLVYYNGEILDYFFGESEHYVDMVKALCITSETYVSPSSKITEETVDSTTSEEIISETLPEA